MRPTRMSSASLLTRGPTNRTLPGTGRLVDPPLAGSARPRGAMLPPLTAPPNPFMLARYGRVFMDSMLDSWWVRARFAGPGGHSLGAELAGLARGASPASAPSKQLLGWAHCYDPDVSVIPPAVAGKWLGVVVDERKQAAAARLPRSVTGPTAARQKPHPAWAAGRSVLGPSLKKPPPIYRRPLMGRRWGSDCSPVGRRTTPLGQ